MDFRHNDWKDGKINILELFAGTKSWTKPYESDARFQQLSIELEMYAGTVCRDILQWNYKAECAGTKFSVLYASPPCNLYFTNLKNLNGTRIYTEKEKELSLKLVDKTIEILNYFKPKYFVIENPVGKMRKHYPQINGFAPLLVDYCEYGVPYKKPTYLWTNIDLKPKRCNHKKHDVSVRIMPREYGKTVSIDKLRKTEGKVGVISETFNAQIAPALAVKLHDLIIDDFINGVEHIQREQVKIDYDVEEAQALKEEQTTEKMERNANKKIANESIGTQKSL